MATQPGAVTAPTCENNGRCAGCPLGPGLAVGGRGRIDAPIVFIGEAPGRDEVRSGKPFTGPSGKLLAKLAQIVDLDLSPECVYITNTMRCPIGSNPPRSALHACRDRLLAEVTAHPRQLLVLLGNSALRALTGQAHAKISQMRGRLLDTEFGLAIATYHPAAILRNPREYPTLLADFHYIADLIRTNGTARRDPGTPRYDLVTDTNAPAVIARLQEQSLLAADIETSGFNEYSDRVLCLGVGYAPNQGYIFPPELIPRAKGLLENPDVQWVWHNGKFDVKFLRRLGIDARVDHDTMLIHYALDERIGTHGLKELAADVLGAPDYEADIKQYLPNKATPYDVIPTDVLHRYLAWDCDSTYQLFQALYPQVQADPHLKKLYHRLLLPASEFLLHVEQNGLPVSFEYLEELDRILSTKRIQLLQQLRQVAREYGWDPNRYADDVGATSAPKMFNPGSPKQVQWLLYHPHGLGLRPPKGYEANSREETLKKLPANPVTEGLIAFREVSKERSTYVDGLRERALQAPDRRAHPTFLIPGTVTGRLASRNPNVQNIPRKAEIRNAVQAPDGYVLIEADYSQAELRMLAHFSKDPYLMRVYQEGRDLHDEVAEDFFPGWKSLTDPVLKREQRIRAKFVNFGIVYGRGPESIDREFGCGMAEAKRYIDTWFSRAERAYDYIQRLRATAAAGGTLVTPFGRKRRFGLVTNENRHTVQNEAANFPIQSAASDLTLISAMRLWPLLEAHGARVINIVHDSILIEAPDDAVLIPELTQLIVRTMQETPVLTLRSEVPFTADVSVGKRWGDLK